MSFWACPVIAPPGAARRAAAGIPRARLPTRTTAGCGAALPRVRTDAQKHRVATRWPSAGLAPPAGRLERSACPAHGLHDDLSAVEDAAHSRHARRPSFATASRWTQRMLRSPASHGAMTSPSRERSRPLPHPLWTGVSGHSESDPNFVTTTVTPFTRPMVVTTPQPRRSKACRGRSETIVSRIRDSAQTLRCFSGAASDLSDVLRRRPKQGMSRTHRRRARRAWDANTVHSRGHRNTLDEVSSHRRRVTRFRAAANGGSDSPRLRVIAFVPPSTNRLNP